MKDPYFWNTTTVHKILDAPEYLGRTTNFKTYSKSYKDNRPRLNPEENQVIFENTHPAIVDEATWEIVRKMREHKRRVPRYGQPGLFSGAAYCSDCGKKLYFHMRELRGKKQTRYEGAYSCSEYRKDVQYLQDRKCTAHYIREEALAQVVLEDMRQVFSYVSEYEEEFVREKTAQSEREEEKNISEQMKTLERSKARISEIDRLFERLYLDNVSGKISDERFALMSASFEKEQLELKSLTADLEKEISSQKSLEINVEKFLATVRKYTEIEELTQAIVHEFIDKIIVHEPENPRKVRKQKIEIIYNNVGVIDRQKMIQVQ
jgi:hypothetical protein